MFTASIDVEALKQLMGGTDPVCGMEVEAAKAAGISTHAGKTYYFCAPACKDAFDADPQKHVKP